MAKSPFRLLNLKAYAQVPSEQIISWFAAPTAGLSSSNTLVKVYTRYAENDDEVLAATVNASDGFVKITDLILHDQHRRAFFKVEVEDINGNTRIYPRVPIDEESKEFGVVTGLRRNMKTLLRLGGNPVLIYQRKGSEAADCGCFDPKLKKIVRSSCSNCFNTGKDGGYYDPILTLAQISPEITASIPGDTLRQNTAAEVLMAEFPRLRGQDLIYEVNTGRRYRVGTIQTSEHNRALINQSFPATRLNPGDVEHTLPVPDLSTLVPVMSRALVAPGGRTIVSSVEGSTTVSQDKKKI